MTNLFLYNQEDKRIQKAKIKDLITAQNWLILAEFENDLHEIYPLKLMFLKENALYFEALFLNLDI